MSLGRGPRTAVRTPIALPGERIGVMGGSFNPPHEGHLLVARTALRRLRLDRLWWLVTPGNPLKENDGLPPLDDRMAACRQLARDPRMVVTGLERELGTPYTAATLAFLVSRFPRVRWVWVMGADNLASFHHWQRWRAIARTMPLAVVDRPGFRLRALASPAARTFARNRMPEAKAAALADCAPPAWALLSARLCDLSSTALRLRSRSGARDRAAHVLCDDPGSVAAVPRANPLK